MKTSIRASVAAALFTKNALATRARRAKRAFTLEYEYSITLMHPALTYGEIVS